MFCSTICRENAFFMYHKHECYNQCIERIYPQYSRVMRLFYFALYLFDDKIEDLKAFILSRGEERKTIFDFDMRDLDPIAAGRNLLLCYGSLMPSKYFTGERRFDLMFQHHPFLKQMWRKEKEFIGTFLEQHYHTTAIFHSDLIKWPVNSKELIHKGYNINTVQRKVGEGYYIFSSMFNHSCLPNVQLHCNINNKMHMIICQNVAKGEQLFVSYK